MVEKFNKFNKFGKRILFLTIILFYFIVVFSNIVFSEENSCKDNILDYFYVENTGSDNEVTLTADSDYSSIEVSFALKLLPRSNKVKEIKHIEFSSNGFVNENFVIEDLFVEKNNDEYILHLKLSPKSFDLKNLPSSVEKSLGVSVLIDYVDVDGNEKKDLFCIPNFDVSFVLDEDYIPEDLVEGINSAKNLYDSFKKVDTGFKLLEATYSLLCKNKQDYYKKNVTLWNNNCNLLREDVKKSLLGEEVNVDEVCNVKKDSFEGSTDEEKLNNCKERFSSCKENYNDVLKSEKEMLDTCMRVSCNPVYTKEEHSKRYFDFLGINYCENNIDSEKCNDQYKRIENTKCEFLDVNTLEKNKGFSISNLYETQICGAPGYDSKDDIKTLMDPSSSVVSSAACMCIPTLSSYVSEYTELYKNYVSCLEGKKTKKASECLNINAVFLCETALDSLSCGFLDFASYSSRVNDFLEENDKAYVISNNNFVNKRANNIKNRYGIIVNYDVDINNIGGSLKNAICRTAFGDENLDWGKILLDTFSLDNFKASITSGVNFCDLNKKLTNNCYCGSNTKIIFNDDSEENNDEFKDNCGSGQICIFKTDDEKFYCKEENEVNIPNNKENERVEEKISFSSPIENIKKVEDKIEIFSDENKLLKKFSFCEKTSDGVIVLKKLTIHSNEYSNYVVPEYDHYVSLDAGFPLAVRSNLFPGTFLIDYCNSINYDCDGNNLVFKGKHCNYYNIAEGHQFVDADLTKSFPIKPVVEDLRMK